MKGASTSRKDDFAQGRIVPPHSGWTIKIQRSVSTGTYVALLAAQFLKETCQRYRKEISGFDDAARQVLLNCPWPGNVLELQHAIERGILMAQDDVIRGPDLGLQIDHEGVEHLEDMTLDDVEKHLIRNACDPFAEQMSGSSLKSLGLSRIAALPSSRPSRGYEESGSNFG